MESIKKAESCWEFFGCPDEVKLTCPAYKTNSGKECWMVAGSFATAETKCIGVAEKIKHCWECPWFKELNPNFDKQ